MQVQSLGGKIPRRRKWQPTPVFMPGNPMDRGAWQATVRWCGKELDMTQPTHDSSVNVAIYYYFLMTVESQRGLKM